MIFSSLEFICVFLPIVFILHTIVPSIKVKNCLLIIASLLFYAYGEPKYVFLLIASSVANYVFALLISKSQKLKKPLLALIVILNIGLLGVFKYYDFFAGSFNTLFGLNASLLELALPIGISFFTFQALSYVVDVYRGVVEAKKNYFDILLYISFFPQLIAGPIVKFRDIDEEIANRKVTTEKIALGLRRFSFGLAKKVLIANTVGAVADSMFQLENGNVNALTAWIAAVSYMLQIYYDFSGYSDMAIGLGKIFGFTFKENFNLPYISTNIQDFWRRWHISMSTWFKEYLYIPLGGNRKGKARTALNKIIVFLSTGLWHGANWTFVLWGVYHGAFLLLEQIVPAIKKLPKWLGHIYSLVVVCVGFVLFRADNIGQAWFFIKNMFSGFSLSTASVSLAAEQFTPWAIFIFIAAILCSGPLNILASKISNKIQLKQNAEKSKGFAEFLTYAFSFAVFFWCIIRLSGSSYNPFLYFKF